MPERVRFTLTDHVADVRLCRAEKSNALDGAMFDALIEVGTELAATDGLRAVVLSGEGRGFCSGIDMAVLRDMEGGTIAGTRNLVTRTHGPCNRFQHAAWVWRDMPVPVLAAVHGFALGGGLELCLGADMRYVAPDARLAVMEVRWGLVPDMGGTQLVRGLVRPDLMRELCFTGREFSGTEALEYGFATRVTATPFETAMDVARVIAANSPHSVRALKRIANGDLGAGMRAGLLAETVEQQELLGTPNQLETIRAAREKRPARFQDH